MPTENWDTIPKLIVHNRAKWRFRTAMCMKKFGIWQRYSWEDYYQNVKYLSLGLISLGLEPGDVVCIIGDNEPEWFWGEFAVSPVYLLPGFAHYYQAAEHSGITYRMTRTHTVVEPPVRATHR